MRLRITETLKHFNSIKGKRLTMRELALQVWKDERDDQTKVNRLSGLNTGRVRADIEDVVMICDVLECSCDELIANYE